MYKNIFLASLFLALSIIVVTQLQPLGTGSRMESAQTTRYIMLALFSSLTLLYTYKIFKNR